MQTSPKPARAPKGLAPLWLVQYVKPGRAAPFPQVLSGQKVLSICVVAPGSKPGCVGLLEGSQTSVDKLATKAELAQFWRALAGHVVANGVRDGRRIDLVGCRLMEAPSEGAALLKELWKETAVPFAAADDASTGYPLSTFIENPLTGDVAMISSRIKAMELYFNQYRLMHTSAASAAVALPGTVSQQQPLALQQPTASGMSGPSAAPLQPATGPTTSQSTVQARVASVGGGTTVNAAPSQPAASTAYQPAAQEAVDFAAAPSFSTGTVVAPATSSAPPAASSAPSGIFAEFAANLGGRDLREVFNRYDQDKSGGLSQSEVLAMVREVVPRATDMDLKHFRAMLDVDGNDIVTLDEFRRALEQNVAIGEKVAAGSDDSEVLQRLHEYLTDNEDLLRSVFKEFDADHSGALDHNELQQLITMIPGLDEAEKKYIMAYMYRCDSNRDQRLTFDELQAVVRSFGAKLNVVRSA